MGDVRATDPLLDMVNGYRNNAKEAVKQLGKVAFSHPEVSQQLHMVVRILERPVAGVVG